MAQTISKSFGFEQALVVLRLGLGKQGDGPPKSGVHTFRFRVVHQTSNDHVEVPIAIGINVPQRAAVQAAASLFQPERCASWR